MKQPVFTPWWANYLLVFLSQEVSFANKKQRAKNHWLCETVFTQHKTSGLLLSVSNTGTNDEPLAAGSIFNPINENSLGSREWTSPYTLKPCLQSPSLASGLIIRIPGTCIIYLHLILYLYVCLCIKLKAPWSRGHHLCIPMYII